MFDLVRMAMSRKRARRRSCEAPRLLRNYDFFGTVTPYVQLWLYALPIAVSCALL